MKHHDRYAVAASFLLASFLLFAIRDMGFLTSVAENGLLDWAGWIFGMVGILLFGFAIKEHRKSH